MPSDRTEYMRRVVRLFRRLDARAAARRPAEAAAYWHASQVFEQHELGQAWRSPRRTAALLRQLRSLAVPA